MKAFKLTLLFIDFDNVGSEGAKQLIEHARLPNHISPGHVMALEERDIGEWEDDHPLNNHKTQIAAFQNLFKPAINHEVLLRKYIQWVGDREGVTFIHHRMEGFTDAEMAELKRLETP